MKVIHLLEAVPAKLLAVIYPGRFQPFHKGHHAAFKQLGKWFGQDNTWISTSDKTTAKDETEDVSFLDFTERKELMVTLYGINPDHIVKCKNPAFSPIEILSLYKAPTVCVMAVGSKDIERYKTSKMFEPYPMHKGMPAPFENVAKDLATANEKTTMYYVSIPAASGGLSGTKCREMLSKVDPKSTDETSRVMKACFGTNNTDIARMVLSNLKGHKV